MKIFLSHPMTGLSKEQILDLRNKAISQIRYKDYEIIDSYIPEFQDTTTPILAISKSIELLNDADLVMFITYGDISYKNSKGCQVEELICDLYKKQKEYIVIKEML